NVKQGQIYFSKPKVNLPRFSHWPSPSLYMLCLWLRPDGIFVTIWVSKVKTAAARKREDVLNDLPARRRYFLQRGFQVSAIKHDQYTSIGGRGHTVGLEEPTIQPGVLNGYIIRAVVDKRPSKSISEEPLGCCKVS